MRLLTTEEAFELKQRVLTAVGRVIRYYREKKNISGKQLGTCLGVSDGMISQYESGKADISLSKMALASAYCNFPLSAYFEVHESKKLLDMFSKLVKIEGDKYKRHKKHLERASGAGRVLKARVYQVGDEEVIEEIPPRPEAPGIPTKQDILYGEVTLNAAPYTERDFVCYLNDEENKEVCQLMMSVGGVLECLDGAGKKKRLRVTLRSLFWMN